MDFSIILTCLYLKSAIKSHNNNIKTNLQPTHEGSANMPLVLYSDDENILDNFCNRYTRQVEFNVRFL